MQLVEGVSDTLIASGAVTSAAAGAVLASIAAPTPGVYKVRAIIVLTGTAETALQNVRLRNNTAAVGGPLPSLSGAGMIAIDFPRVTVTGGNLDLQAIALAVVGSIYNVVLIATRVG